MNIIFDGVLILILVISIYKGYKDGFVKTLLSFISLIIAGAIAFFIANFLSGLIYINIISPNIINSVINNENFSSTNIIDSTKMVLEILPQLTGNLVDYSQNNFGEVLQIVTGNFQGTDADLINKIIDVTLGPIIKSAVTLAIWCVLFLIMIPVTRIMIRKFKYINNIPIIGGVNKVLGLVSGTLIGAVFVFVVVVGLRVGVLFSNEKTLSYEINNTVIVKPIYDIVTEKIF